jgi:hypothetical protein
MGLLAAPKEKCFPQRSMAAKSDIVSFHPPMCVCPSDGASPAIWYLFGARAWVASNHSSINWTDLGSILAVTGAAGDTISCNFQSFPLMQFNNYNAAAVQ